VDCLNVVHPGQSCTLTSLDKRSQLAIHSRFVHRVGRFTNTQTSNVSDSKRDTCDFDTLSSPQIKGALIMIINLIKRGAEKNYPPSFSACSTEPCTPKQTA
jgi:hypothetical protein